MIRFTLPFKCRKNIKSAKLLLKRAHKLYVKPTVIKFENLIVIYDSSVYATNQIFSMYSNEWKTLRNENIKNLLKYCDYCLKNNKIVTYASYNKNFKKTFNLHDAWQAINVVPNRIYPINEQI